jgi:hypothetical protein
MGLWSKLTGASTEPAATRTPRERARRSREIRAIDANTAAWLRAGIITPKRGKR